MQFEDFRVPVKLKLSALWASLMSCYIYADYFGLFRPGKLTDMNRGIVHPFGQGTPLILFGVSVMMVVPSLMIAAPLLVRPGVARWANLILGPVYAMIIALTMIGSPPYYLLFGTIEVMLGCLVALYAWTWPRGETA